MRSRTSLFAACAALLFACDPAAEEDAGTADAQSAEGVLAPMATALPSFGPCPSAWSEVTSDDGVTTCAPPTGDACPAGMTRFLDSVDCVTVGDACPAGDWAEAPAGVNAIYVRRGATGGDGTQALPYGTIQEAANAAGAGDAIMVAKGTYAEAVVLGRDAQLIGACATETVIAPDGRGFALSTNAADVTVANLTVRPVGERVGIDNNQTLTLRGVIIENAADISIAIWAGDVTIRDVLIRAPRALMDNYGHGVRAGGATVDIERLVVDGCPGTGLVSLEGAQVTARNVTVRGCGGRVSPSVLALQTGQLELSDSLVEDGTGVALSAQYGGTLTVDQVVVRRGTAAQQTPTARLGAGAFISDSTFTARRVFVEDMEGFGLLLGGSAIELEDVVVHEIGSSLVDDNPSSTGIALTDCEDLMVRRAWVGDTDLVGLLAQSSMGGVLEDITLRRTGSDATGYTLSRGLVAIEGEYALRRADVAEARGAGLFVVNVQLTAEDIVVRDLNGVSTGLLGRGIEVGGGANVTLTRARIERARAAGLLLLEQSTVTAEHLTVLDTLPRDCALGYCDDYPAGNGIVVQDSSLTVRHFEVRDARLCGVQVLGETDLRDGVVQGALVGACVQLNGYETTRLTDGVLFRDNGANMDAAYHAPLEPAPAPSF